MSKLWGGRFKGKIDEQFDRFNSSFAFDRRLFEVDIRASLAHCDGLEAAGVITRSEAERIRSGLETILKRGKLDPDYFDQHPAEDVHSFVQARLVQLIGDTGYKLHTARSRNDQVATDLRLYLRDEIDNALSLIKKVQTAIVDLAEANLNIPFPGYTHLQKAQPVLFSHYCLAYFESFRRDRERLTEIRKRVNVLPLGSGALAGTNFPVDRNLIAEKLLFDSVSANSMDAISDRDFIIEFTAAASLIAMHLSRLAEDLIIYSSSEFGLIELSDAVATGSSLMPQKKNPDALELIRGKAGRIFGHHIALLTTLKGLPLTYNKDMQEDKEALFDTIDTLAACLSITEIVLRNLRVNPARATEAASTGYMNATDLADYLVRKGLPFRMAHETASQIVLYAIENGKQLEEIPLDKYGEFSSLFQEDVYQAITLDASLSGKAQTGGTSPERVGEALNRAREIL